MRRFSVCGLLVVLFVGVSLAWFDSSLLRESYKTSLFLGGIAGLAGLILFADVLVWIRCRGWAGGGQTIEEMIAESNKIARARGAEEKASITAEPQQPKVKPMIACPHCAEQMPKFEMYCPSCGKDKKAQK